MDKKTAFNLIKVFLQTKEFPTENLEEENNYFQAMIDSAIVSFNYRKEEEVLVCSSLIYQFSNAPQAKVLEVIEEEAKLETRGAIKFQPENKTLYVSKTYEQAIDEITFISEIDSLIETSLEWSSEVLDRVASKAFHPEELE